LPGVDEVLASFLYPASIFISDDFPTFERPVKPYSGKSGGGHWSALAELFMNSALLIIIRESLFTSLTLYLIYTSIIREVFPERRLIS
jgi:hypothetical protein